MLRVLITNIKGGCGKTTIATNLAAAFAVGGFATGLAEVDRQRSSLSWLKLRDGHARPIQGLDWRKQVGEIPPDLRRLVIDAPANLRMRHVDDLIGEADLVGPPRHGIDLSCSAASSASQVPANSFATFAYCSRACLDLRSLAKLSAICNCTAARRERF